MYNIERELIDCTKYGLTLPTQRNLTNTRIFRHFFSIKLLLIEGDMSGVAKGLEDIYYSFLEKVQQRFPDLSLLEVKTELLDELYRIDKNPSYHQFLCDAFVSEDKRSLEDGTPVTALHHVFYRMCDSPRKKREVVVLEDEHLTKFVYTIEAVGKAIDINETGKIIQKAPW